MSCEFLCNNNLRSQRVLNAVQINAQQAEAKRIKTKPTITLLYYTVCHNMARSLAFIRLILPWYV